MNTLAAWLRGMPPPARWTVVAAFCAGVTGGIAGLVIGLIVYAPTAPFAAVELGLPSAFAGAVIGLVTGTIVTTARRIRHHGETSL